VGNGLAGRFDSRSGLIEFGYDSIEGAGHVGSGVTVGDRVDVEAINARSMGLHSISESNYRTTKPIGVKMFG
jgi:hypothetical protein